MRLFYSVNEGAPRRAGDVMCCSRVVHRGNRST